MKIVPMSLELIDHMGDDLAVCRTKTQRKIVQAYIRGYTVTTDGFLYGPKGLIVSKLYGKQRYPTFSYNGEGEVYGIPIHLFSAYCFYGTGAFEPGLVVRHLDGNTLNFSKENIVLGTYSENNLDKSQEVRVSAAKAARKAQEYTPANAKLNPNQVQQVREYYRNLNGKKAANGATAHLARLLNVSKTVLHKIKIGEYYQNI